MLLCHGRGRGLSVCVYLAGPVRMPRGASKPILEYDHPGRTVLLGETMDQVGRGSGR